MTAQHFFAVEYSPADSLPVATKKAGKTKLATTDLGEHATEQLSITHAKKILGAASNIKSLIQGKKQRWVVYSAIELSSLLQELNIKE